MVSKQTRAKRVGHSKQCDVHRIADKDNNVTIKKKVVMCY